MTRKFETKRNLESTLLYSGQYDYCLQDYFRSCYYNYNYCYCHCSVDVRTYRLSLSVLNGTSSLIFFKCSPPPSLCTSIMCLVEKNDGVMKKNKVVNEMNDRGGEGLIEEKEGKKKGEKEGEKKEKGEKEGTVVNNEEEDERTR